MSDQKPGRQEGSLAKLLRLLKEEKHPERRELRKWLWELGEREREALEWRLWIAQDKLHRRARSLGEEPKEPDWSWEREQLGQLELQALLELIGLEELLRDAITYLHESKPLSARDSAAPISLYFDLNNFSLTDIVDIIALLSELYADIGGDSLVIDDITLLDFQPALVPVEV